jgi:hypothetical protein
VTDAQLSIILAAIATLGGSLVAALRWAVNRVTTSNDAGTAALIANTASNAVLVVKLDHLARSIERVDDFVKEETSGVYSTNPQPQSTRQQQPQRTRTPAGGVGLRNPRPGTYHDGDD